MKNKKGAEMTIGTIIIIILALVVLAILIYGFTYGWGSLWRDLTGLSGSDANVQTIVNSCSIACSTNGRYDYCEKQRDVIFEDVNGKDNPKNGVYTCFKLSSERPEAGLKCDRIDCPQNIKNPPAP